MPKVRIAALKQSPYVCTRKDNRVDPTREGVEKAIRDGRFSERIMDQDYGQIVVEIAASTKSLDEIDRQVHEYHNERVACLVRTMESWLDAANSWPITANQFNQVIAGNHRIRALRYRGVDQVEVVFIKDAVPRSGYDLPEIW